MTASAFVEIELDAEADIDAVDEIRLRTWARRHYSPADERDVNWHPVVLDEMEKIDREEAHL
jgi:hypothetical protein